MQTKKRLLVVDDFLYVYLNGNFIAEHGRSNNGGQVNANITYNLLQGTNIIEFLLCNTGGPAQMLLMGDIVDNDTVKFA